MGGESAVEVGDVVMEENVGGAGRANAKERADDSGSGHSGFENVSLKPLVEKIGGTHGHELDEGVALVGGEPAETLHQKVQLLEIFGIECGGVRPNHGKKGLHKAALGRHHLRN